MEQQLQIQREYFDSGMTHSYQFRIAQLKCLEKSIKTHESDLAQALNKDLGKNEFEIYAGEISAVYAEIKQACKNLRCWMKPKKVRSPLNLFYSKSSIERVPLGQVLIIAPWNYPLLLLFSPLVGAIASGNCVVLKPSELAPNVAEVMATIIKDAFNAEYIYLINGDGAQIVPELIEKGSFNHVIFTGSTKIGTIIAKQCAAKLIPYTLELGGKSPTIIDKSADLNVAAKRIIWGKFLNSGQTCIAPDYLLVDKQIYQKFILLLKETIIKFGINNLENNASIVNKREFERLIGYCRDGEVVSGGKYDESKLKIEPTLLINPDLDSPVMHTEIFGPLLPILTYNDTQELISIIRKNRYPLAMYLYSTDNNFCQNLIKRIECGGVGINTNLYQFVNKDLPFGGVMTSGFGYYHGKHSFELLTHPKAIVKTTNWPDLNLKYPPYTKWKIKLLRLIS